MIEEGLDTVVIDVGSCSMKGGFAGDDSPRSIFPNTVGTQKPPSFLVGLDAGDHYVGWECWAKRSFLNIKNSIPFDNKSSVDWECLDKAFFHCPYGTMKYTCEYFPLIITSLHSMDEKSFEKFCEMLLVQHNYMGLLIVDSSVCAMYSSGRTDGLSIDLGYSNIEVAAVYGGLPIHHSKIVLEDKTAEKRTKMGGKLITDTLVSLLSSNSGNFKPTTSAELEIVNDMKEKTCYLELQNTKFQSFDNMDMSKNAFPDISFSYELPDGSKVILEKERFLAPEILFNPSLINYKLPGIHKLIKMCIEKTCDEDLRKTMYQNLVISGGTSMIEGLDERIKIELQELNRKVKVHAIAERKFSHWIGGSIIGCLSGVNQWYATKEDYDEHGYSIVEKKSPFCSKVNKKQHHLILSEISHESKDNDLKERTEYILVNYKANNGFKIHLYGENEIHVRFKSLMLL